MKHAELLQMSKAERMKQIDGDFVNRLHEIDADFKAFCSTGIAARISSLHSCYSMYLNSLDRQPPKRI